MHSYPKMLPPKLDISERSSRYLRRQDYSDISPDSAVASADSPVFKETYIPLHNSAQERYSRNQDSYMFKSQKDLSYSHSRQQNLSYSPSRQQGPSYSRSQHQSLSSYQTQEQSSTTSQTQQQDPSYSQSQQQDLSYGQSQQQSPTSSQSQQQARIDDMYKSQRQFMDVGYNCMKPFMFVLFMIFWIVKEPIIRFVTFVSMLVTYTMVNPILFFWSLLTNNTPATERKVNIVSWFTGIVLTLGLVFIVQAFCIPHLPGLTIQSPLVTRKSYDLLSERLVSIEEQLKVHDIYISKYTTEQQEVIKDIRTQHNEFWKTFHILKQQQQQQKTSNDDLKLLVNNYKNQVAAQMETLTHRTNKRKETILKVEYTTVSCARTNKNNSNNDWAEEVNAIVGLETSRDPLEMLICVKK